jgi:hypothetical protein
VTAAKRTDVVRRFDLSTQYPLDLLPFTCVVMYYIAASKHCSSFDLGCQSATE